MSPVTFIPHEDPLLWPSRLASLAVQYAEAEAAAGAREVGGNNKGKWVEKYRGDRRPASWCAAFVSWCFVQAARELDEPLPFEPHFGAKKLWKRIRRAGEGGSKPYVGDVVCWDRGRLKPNGRPSWQGHVGIVVSLDPDGLGLQSVEGNKGARGIVKAYPHELEEGRLMGFARI